jgi:hypothetical protein
MSGFSEDKSSTPTNSWSSLGMGTSCKELLMSVNLLYSVESKVIMSLINIIYRPGQVTINFGTFSIKGREDSVNYQRGTIISQPRIQAAP